ncbi:hypothetical protein F511_20880 [Dorcoceras hygrometricum]|uniref:Pentatricopeptide repeat-containing protein n=1 Tax=Dorcoceras hygrometricum TaxID=472368 RepID=A0A2Z7B344_9LAMI|nr:hypothetical protein F511_20880 [Dorcoceras hygrometricum]
MSIRILRSAFFLPTPIASSLKCSYRILSTDYNFQELITPQEIGISDATTNSPPQNLSAQDFSFIRDSVPEDKVGDFESHKCSKDALLIVSALRNYSDQLVEKSQKFLRQFRERLDENLVVDVLTNVKKPELGIRFFMWAGRQIGYTHTLAVYDALLELLGCNKNDDRVPDYFSDDDREVLGTLLNVLIRKCCHNGMWNLALQELGRLKDFGFKPSRLTYNALIRVFLDAGKLDTAFLLYREMSYLGFKMHMDVLGRFLYLLCKVGKWRDALNLIEEEEAVPDTVIYTKMIMGLCEGSLFEEAMEFLNRMRSDACVPNIVTYKILLCGCLNKGKLGRCKRILSMMITEGCYPSPKIFCSLVHAYCKSGDHAYAYKLLKKMENCGFKPGYVVYNIFIGNICGNEKIPRCPPNIVTFSALIDGYCKAGDLAKACAIYEKMRGNGDIHDVNLYFEITDDSSKEPNVITYGALINGLCKAHKVGEARNLLDTMWANDCEPNQVVYDALIDGFCKVGKLDEAQEIFAKMSEHGYSPNVYTYSSLIDRLFKEKRLDLALKVLAKMLECSCTPNVVTYTEMIDGLCKVGKTDEAYKLMLMMEEKGCNPNVVTYTAMIDGFGKAGKVDRSLELVQEMVSKGCAPNYITYRVLINHCCGAGLLDEAYQLLQEMKQIHWPSYLANYHKVVEGYSKDLIMRLELVDEISKDDSTPLAPAYKIVIDSFQKAGRLEIAFDLLKEFKLCPNFSSKAINVYSSLIWSLSSHRVDKAFELYADMMERGEIPDFAVIVDLIKGLIKADRWDDALLLSESLCCMVCVFVHCCFLLLSLQVITISFELNMLTH